MVGTKNVLITEECGGKDISIANYTHLRAYHACRLLDIETYKKEGIVPLVEQSAIEYAIKTLSDERLTEDRVRKKAEEIWIGYGSNIHRVWLALEQSELLEEAGHYLIYGSEFLNAVAGHLLCRNKLKEIGRPTIIVCDVPLNKISDTWTNGLEQAIKDEETSSCSIAVDCVAPEDIVDFIYPTGYVVDPILGCTKYRLG